MKFKKEDMLSKGGDSLTDIAKYSHVRISSPMSESNL